MCSAKKDPARRNRAPLQVYCAGAPIECMVVDTCLPMLQGNRYICAVMDYFTKCPKAYALPNHKAKTVVSVSLSEFFTRFGMPAELHSDPGREFESNVFQECCELLGVQKTQTTPLHPHSDGRVEHFNRTLAQQLPKYCNEGQEEWDVQLPAMLMAYQSTDFSPAHLMFSRELRLPVDLATGRQPDMSLPTVTTGNAAALQDTLVEVHHHVRGELRVAGQAMKETYDRRMREAKYSAGDRVWLYIPARSGDFHPSCRALGRGRIQ